MQKWKCYCCRFVCIIMKKGKNFFERWEKTLFAVAAAEHQKLYNTDFSLWCFWKLEEWHSSLGGGGGDKFHSTSFFLSFTYKNSNFTLDNETSCGMCHSPLVHTNNNKCSYIINSQVYLDINSFNWKKSVNDNFIYITCNLMCLLYNIITWVKIITRTRHHRDN